MSFAIIETADKLAKPHRAIFADLKTDP